MSMFTPEGQSDELISRTGVLAVNCLTDSQNMILTTPFKEAKNSHVYMRLRIIIPLIRFEQKCRTMK